MAYCEAEDEYIAAVLGHGSLDMLPHYRKRSLERLEKEANAKNYVDMYGRVTSFKPRKQRYEQLAQIMDIKVSTSLGECHRPTMLGDCHEMEPKKNGAGFPFWVSDPERTSSQG